MPEVSPSERALLLSYFPEGWVMTESSKSELDQHPIYAIMTSKSFLTRRTRLVALLTAFEGVIRADPFAASKRRTVSGMLRTKDQCPHVLAELQECLFLSVRAAPVVYAPRFPDNGPDFDCVPGERTIEVEVTALTGTDQFRHEDRLRNDLEWLLYERPSGRELTVVCDWLQTLEDRQVVYRAIKKWISSEPGIGEHTVSTQRGALRVHVHRADRNPAHTYLAGHIWRSHENEVSDDQVIEKIRSKTSQLTAKKPAVVALYAIAMLFDWEWPKSFNSTSTTFSNCTQKYRQSCM